MNNFIRNTFFFSVACFSVTVNAQKSKNDSILLKADSIVLSLTSQDFFDNITRDNNIHLTEWTSMSSMTDLTKVNNSNYKKNNSFITYMVIYSLKEPIRFNNMHIINEIGGLGPAGAFIEFDSKLNLINPPKFTEESNLKRELKAFERFKAARIISVSDAKKVSETKFAENSKEPIFSSLFIYDTNSDRFYWEIKKFKGFQKVTIETVYINAETSDFMNKKTSSLYRTFWQALFNNKMI